MSDNLAQAASAGFHDAGSYDAYRPSYIDAVVDGLLSKLEVPSAGAAEVRIVEIAAGTGKFTETLSRRAVAAANASLPAWSIVAVEPHDQMRAQLDLKNLPHVTVVNGHGSSVPSVADGWADAVIIAQAFHWFANQESLREVHRILKPNGVVGVVWNVEDYNKPKEWPASTPWEQQVNDLVYALGADGNPRFRDSQWQAAFTEASASPSPIFAPLADHRVQWTVQLTPDALWKRLLTLSQIAVLPEGDNDDGTEKPTSRGAFRRRLDAILEKAERNAAGEVTVHATTYYAWARRV